MSANMACDHSLDCVKFFQQHLSIRDSRETLPLSMSLMDGSEEKFQVIVFHVLLFLPSLLFLFPPVSMSLCVSMREGDSGLSSPCCTLVFLSLRLAHFLPPLNPCCWFGTNFLVLLTEGLAAICSIVT